jgi:hypothetical protein
VKTKLIIPALAVLLLAGLVFGPPAFDAIVSYFSYNQYEGLIEVSSPGGEYIASGCHIIGGATTTNSTFVEIRLKGEERDYRKNEVVFMVDNLGPFDISWMNDRVLVIRYVSGPIYIQKFQWKDVGIKYGEMAGSSAR